MKKNSLSQNDGLSLSQAQSISNLCNQRAIDIAANLQKVNNVSKTVMIGDKEYILINPIPMPADVVELLKEKAALHACQAFLMENIKSKDLFIKSIQNEIADVSSIVFPVQVSSVIPKFIHQVSEEFGWEQLSIAEVNEYLEAEAFAAHIGQFIHKDGILTGLRNELPHIPAIEWMTIKDGEKSPVTITTHHKAEDLPTIHEELAAEHRKFEQRVNYFKAKVKNITTEENGRIANINADSQNAASEINSKANLEYETLKKNALEAVRGIQGEFEKFRQESIKMIASMRIKVDARFQPVIDKYLDQLK